jgi:hypothetical protein
MFDETYQNGLTSDPRSLPNPDRISRASCHLQKPPIEAPRASRARPEAPRLSRVSRDTSSHLSFALVKFKLYTYPSLPSRCYDS